MRGQVSETSRKGFRVSDGKYQMHQSMYQSKYQVSIRVSNGKGFRW